LFLHLKAPVARVTGFDTPFPYALEKAYMPDARRALEAIRAAAAFCDVGCKCFHQCYDASTNRPWQTKGGKKGEGICSVADRFPAPADLSNP
jgi:hypothetical protein